MAVIAVILSKTLNVPARAHFYTVHSYIGAATIALSFVQFVLALGFFRLLGLNAAARQSLSTYHRPLGFAITVAGLTTVMSGFNEVQVLHMIPGESHYAGSVVIVSVIGLFVLALLIMVTAALSDSARGQEGAVQFTTAPKAHVCASASGVPV
ncbi:hypothetical protein WJX81_004346 [Elliptochloris bilobata]|uniref:Cytochrome b561 domain-containing protein n=1 Tax=Elliptochloris bilobata TaxID=381761 RepID=A0AAW1R000_9CHLO